MKVTSLPYIYETKGCQKQSFIKNISQRIKKDKIMYMWLFFDIINKQ